jgi:ABC-type multidrug transport system ATPase subunit
MAGPVEQGRKSKSRDLEKDQEMQTTIEVNGVRKRFGPTLALDGMSFTVEPGQVTGFVGPNGAGKSTTMRVILGLDAADEGKALVGGQPYASLRQPMRVLGSLLDAGALQPSRSARNHLLWLAHSQGLAADGRAVLVSSHLMSELQDAADHLVVVGRGKVIADTTVASLLAAASGDRVRLRTSARPEAVAVLEKAGATAVPSGQDVLTISGLAPGRVVALLGEKAVPFSEVSAHRVTLEQAYMELTRKAVEFRPAGFDAEAAQEVPR